MDSFEPWIDRLQRAITPAVLLQEAHRIPTEWIDDPGAWKHLLESLDGRRKRLPELIWSARKSTPEPFKNWKPRSFVPEFGQSVANPIVNQMGHGPWLSR
jgi:hypothetical protein